MIISALSLQFLRDRPDYRRSMDMDILLLQFCAVARENMERAVFMRMAERFEVSRWRLCEEHFKRYSWNLITNV